MADLANRQADLGPRDLVQPWRGGDGAARGSRRSLHTLRSQSGTGGGLGR